MTSNNQLDQIQKIIEDGDPEILQKLYRETSGSTLVKQQDIMKIWYGITPLSKCSDAVLNLLSEILLCEKAEFPAEIVEDRQAFMDDPNVSKSAKTRCKSMFSMFRPYEAKLQQDFALMEKSDAVPMLENMGTYNVGYMRANLYSLNMYCQWRVQTGRPVNDIWLNGQGITVQDIDFSVAMREKCYADPSMLVSKIESSCSLYGGYAAPVIAALIWMGFDRDEITKIKNDEVNLVDQTVRGVPIPYAFRRIMDQYLGTSEVERPTYTGTRKMYLEDIGYLLKRVVTAPNGKPATIGYISTALSMSDLSYKDIQCSSRYYQMMMIEEQEKRKITQADVMEIWQMKIDQKQPMVGFGDHIVEYQFWRNVFHSSGEN